MAMPDHKDWGTGFGGRKMIHYKNHKIVRFGYPRVGYIFIAMPLDENGMPAASAATWLTFESFIDLTVYFARI